MARIKDGDELYFSPELVVWRDHALFFKGVISSTYWPEKNTRVYYASGLRVDRADIHHTPEAAATAGRAHARTIAAKIRAEAESRAAVFEALAGREK